MKKKTTAVIAAILGLIAIIIIGVVVIKPMANYNNAKKQLESGEYDKAIQSFSDLGDYKDSQEMVLECQYQKGISLSEDGLYDEAHLVFSDILSYKDSEERDTECRYQIACQMLENKEYEKAANMFDEIADYKDSSDKLTECKYSIGKVLYNDGNYEDSINYFSETLSYKDSSKLLFNAEDNLTWADIESARKVKNYPYIIELVSSLHNKGNNVGKVLDESYSYMCEQFYNKGLIDIAASYGNQVNNKSEELIDILNKIEDFNKAYGRWLGVWKPTWGLNEEDPEDCCYDSNAVLVPKYVGYEDSIAFYNHNRVKDFPTRVRNFNGKSCYADFWEYNLYTLIDDETMIKTNEVEDPGSKTTYKKVYDYSGVENNFTRCEGSYCYRLARNFVWSKGTVYCYCDEEYESIFGNADDDSITVGSNYKQCSVDGCQNIGTYEIVGLNGKEYYCTTHYNEIADAYNSIVSTGAVCEVEGCNNNGTHPIDGLNGYTEYYCDEHYEEMLEIIKTLDGE